jgi:hypothetical protein
VLPVCLPDVPRSKALTATSPGLPPHDSTLLVGDGVAGGVTGALPEAGGVALGVETGAEPLSVGTARKGKCIQVY